MKRALCSILAASFLMSLPVIPAHAETEISIRKTIQLENAPVDMVASRNGRYIFVLTDNGEIQIYTASGILDDTIQVGKGVVQVIPGAREDMLFLRNRADKTIRMITFDSVKNIKIEGAPFTGAEKAPVTIVLFSDFQCPYCAKIGDITDKVLAKYPKDVKLVFKHYPLTSHKFARTAAIASVAAQNQNKFWEFHDRLFDSFSGLNMDKVREIAKALGLNMEKFEKDMADPAIAAKIEDDKADGIAASVRSTPTAFINGRRLQSRGEKAFYDAIDAELKRLKKPVKAN